MLPARALVARPCTAASAVVPRLAELWARPRGGSLMVSTRSAARRASSTATAVAEQAIPSPLKFEGVNNCRDLAEAFADMRAGCVFRTAAPVGATQSDISLLFNHLGIKDIIDLRSDEEIRLEGELPGFEGFSFCKFRRDPAVKRVVPDASTYVHGSSSSGSDVMRVQIAIMEKHRYYASLLSRMSKRKALRVLATALVDKPASRRLAIDEVNAGGLEGLYKVFLEDSPQELVAALRHIKASAEASRPVIFFCKAGKDRTGLVAALLLSVLGASEDAVLADYVRSDAFHMVALAGLEDNEKVTGLDRRVFERAPREAMRWALRHIDDTWGGADKYLAAAGFGPDEQQGLRDALLRPGAAGRSGGAGGEAPAAASKL